MGFAHGSRCSSRDTIAPARHLLGTVRHVMCSFVEKQAQKMAAAAAAAERRAAKLRRRNATLTKLLAREHGACVHDAAPSSRRMRRPGWQGKAVRMQIGCDSCKQGCLAASAGAGLLTVLVLAGKREEAEAALAALAATITAAPVPAEPAAAAATQQEGPVEPAAAGPAVEAPASPRNCATAAAAPASKVRWGYAGMCMQQQGHVSSCRIRLQQ